MKNVALACSIAVLLCSGCIQSVPITYYHLPLFEIQHRHQKKQSFDVEVSVADYLDRQAYLTRKTPVSFDVNDAALWGSSLQEQIELLVTRRLRAEYRLDSLSRTDGNTRNLHIAVDQADVNLAGVARVQLRWWHRKDQEHREDCSVQTESASIDNQVQALSSTLHECVGNIIDKIQ